MAIFSIYQRFKTLPMLKISIADAPTGSGKTTALAKNAITMLNNNKTVIFIQPTKDLNQQTAKQLADLNRFAHIELINGDTYPKATVARLAEHLRKPFDQPHVILTTHESFERIPYRTGMERYDLFCDEIPKAFKTVSERLPHNHGKLTEAITVISRGSSYGEVRVTNEGQLRRIAENRKNDAVDGIFQPFARSILDDNYRTFVNLEQYENLRRGSSVETHLTMFSLVEPKLYAGFQSVRMAGARATETILHKWFKRL
ncbi:DEAD/DEAH box helicase family protein [Methylobacterium sp. J-048]|uniref:DEAD/DEAH box helicase family protein n=1 Tax=Methylobacterium sp. J-048 TaxID=2836635 RepID=UPI001FBBB0CA|nr:DEAD/DEAH box helicase family protein [Methylobacterium sp. J-048]MCJ2058087.1 DEAD/DEAH box helicase family protein [Methylobacterium sp. J-048]